MHPLYRFRLAVVALVLVFVLGIVGYMALEGWSLHDALFMTVTTVTTTGLQVRNLSQAGQGFTLVLLMAGVVVGAYTAATFTEMLVTERLDRFLGRRRMERDLTRLTDHYIICGWGRMGQELVDQFRSRGVPFVVIETNEAKCQKLAEVGVIHVHGDASDDSILKKAGVERARGLITVAPRDADNIFITLSARALNKSLFIVARSIYDQDVHKLEIAGADRVISPYVIGARRIAAAVLNPGVIDFLDVEVHREELDWELEDVPVTPQAPFRGKPLRESGIRQQTGCMVLAIREGASGRVTSNPPPETLLREGDMLIVLGTRDQLQKIEALAGLPAGTRRERPSKPSRKDH